MSPSVQAPRRTQAPCSQRSRDASHARLENLVRTRFLLADALRALFLQRALSLPLRVLLVERQVQDPLQDLRHLRLGIVDTEHFRQPLELLELPVGADAEVEMLGRCRSEDGRSAPPEFARSKDNSYDEKKE